MSISGISGASISSAAGIEALISQTIALERQPVTRLETQKGNLEIKRGIYNDIKSKVETLRASLQDITDDTTGILNKYSATIADEDVLDVTVDSDNTEVGAGQYSITVNKLAQAHRVASPQQTDSSSALNLSGTLTINGQDITIEEADSLSDIRDRINEYDFEGQDANIVMASIVDNTLVLSAETGTDNAMTISSDAGLGLIDNDPDGGDLNVIQTAQNAELTVNGLDITRSDNTGLDDIVEGLSFNLLAEGETTKVTIAKNNDEVKAKVKTFLTDFNDLIKHLKVKTEPQLDEAAGGENPTYTAAPLGRDYSMRALRYDLSSKLLASYSGATTGAPRNLTEIGIDLDDNLTFELAEESDLTDALDENFQGVSDLLGYVLGRIDDTLTPFIEGDHPILTASTDGIDEQIESIEDQIDNHETRLTRREEILRQQYYGLQTQLLTLQYEFQNTQAAMFGSINQQY